MVVKFGKRGVRSGNTLRRPCWRYLLQYRHCSYVIREDENINGGDIIGEKLGVDDIHSRNLEYSLNKKGRWVLPNRLAAAIKEGQFDLEDFGVRLFVKHNTSDNYANCLSAYFSKDKLRETTVFRKTGQRKKRRFGYMCLRGLKNRNSGIKRKSKKLWLPKITCFCEDCIRKYDQQYFLPKPEKREITFEVVYPCSLPSLLTHRYECIGDTTVEKIDDKRFQNKMFRRYVQDIVKSDVLCFHDESEALAEQLEDEFEDCYNSRHEDLTDIKDFILHALSYVNREEKDKTLNDYVFVSEYEECLQHSEPADQPVRVILNHVDTNREVLSEVYGDKYVECRCFPRKFIIDISDEVMALDMFSRQWNFSPKPVYACIVFVHDINNEIDTKDDQVYKIYINTSLDTDMKNVRISTIFEYTETSVEDCLNRSLFFMESFPNLVQHREYSIYQTKGNNQFANLYGWKGKSYAPNDGFHFKSFMASCHTNDSDPCDESFITENPTSKSFEQVCGICYVDIGLESSGTALSQCGHWFCDACWEAHMKMKIKSGSFYVQCPEYSCKSEVDKSTMLSFLCIEDIIKITKFGHDFDIDRNREAKWCPNVRCCRVLVQDNPGMAMVQCDCGQTVCFECLGQAHWPAPCQSVRPYQRVLNEIGVNTDDADTTCLLAVYGMNCPNCNRFFEKINGCPRMTCLCHISFCWGCGKEWSSSVHGKRCETLGRKNVHIYLTCRFLYSASLQNEWIDAALEHRLCQQPQKIRQLRSNVQHIAKTLREYMNRSSCNISLDFIGSRKGYTKESQKIAEFLQSLLVINSELHFIAENIALSLGSDIQQSSNEYFKHQLKRITFNCRTIEECLTLPIKSAMSRLRRLKEMRCVSLNVIKTLVAYTKPRQKIIENVYNSNRYCDF